MVIGTNVVSLSPMFAGDQTHKTMPYVFKVTANRNIGGSKGIAKGTTVQISKDGYQIYDILVAYDPQSGIKITGISISTSAFTIQKL